MSINQAILAPVQAKKASSNQYWWQQQQSGCEAPRPRPGDRCPHCQTGVLAYDSLFLLTCDQCGQVAESGAFT